VPVQAFSATWRFDASEVLGEPDPGEMRSGPAPSTWVALSFTDADGIDQAAELLEFTTGDLVRVQEVADALAKITAELSGDPIDHGTWVEFPVAVIDEAGMVEPHPNELVLVSGLLLAAPAVGAYCTAEQLAAALHIRWPTDADKRAALERACQAAADEIDQDLDRITPLPDPTPAVIVQTNIDRGVEWYKAPDAAFGIVGVEDTGAIRAPKDSFARHAQNITPWKQRWGVA
jgi:hypothetical protein